MPVQIVRNDITKMKCDAIVNATDESYSGSGGVDLAIHTAAGEKLAEACRALGAAAEGEAKLTPGFDLPCRAVIHTVGPRWYGGVNGEREKLRNCYKNSLKIAKEEGFGSVAFPLISAGTFGLPQNEAMSIALEVISGFLMDNDMLVYIVLYNGEAYRMGQKLFADIKSYIDDNYVLAYRYSICADGMPKSNARENVPMPKASKRPAARPKKTGDEDADMCFSRLPTDRDDLDAELEKYLKSARDESFSQMLLRCIDERGMKDSECYKRANIDRKLFSKIRSGVNYRPSKTTVQAFAVALEMDMEETEELMKKAGYAFSNTSKGDLIVRFFIERRCYDVITINEALFAFDQKLLGG